MTTRKKEALGFIGLGLLGLPIATNLVEAGYDLRVFNRTASKAEPLVARGATLAASAAEVPAHGGIVATLVWDDAAVESVVTDAFLAQLGPGGIHIGMSTILPATARRLAERHAKAGSFYVEAPIFGRPEAAVAKKLVLAVTGPGAAKERVRPVLEAMGGSDIFDFGESAGAGVAVKLAGNLLIISAARSMFEAFSFAEKSGVEPKDLAHMLTTTLFSAPIYQSYSKRLVDGAPPMTSGIPEKDLGLFRRTAAETGVPSPIAAKLYELVARPA